MLKYLVSQFDDNIVLTAVASATCGVLIGWYLNLFCNSKEKIGAKNTKEEVDGKESMGDGTLDLTDPDGWDADGEFKMVIVVRQDLKMGKGKIAAQCCHAAVGAYKQLQAKNKKVLRSWEYNGQPKVVVKCQDESELIALHQHARALNLTATLIQDAGRTQISPGSKTVIGVGPGPGHLVDTVTGHLKLL